VPNAKGHSIVVSSSFRSQEASRGESPRLQAAAWRKFVRLPEDWIGKLQKGRQQTSSPVSCTISSQGERQKATGYRYYAICSRTDHSCLHRATTPSTPAFKPQSPRSTRRSFLAVPGIAISATPKLIKSLLTGMRVGHRTSQTGPESVMWFASRAPTSFATREAPAESLRNGCVITLRRMECRKHDC
jgi:hypothetical protein